MSGIASFTIFNLKLANKFSLSSHLVWFSDYFLSWQPQLPTSRITRLHCIARLDKNKQHMQHNILRKISFDNFNHFIFCSSLLWFSNHFTFCEPQPGFLYWTAVHGYTKRNSTCSVIHVGKYTSITSLSASWFSLSASWFSNH